MNNSYPVYFTHARDFMNVLLGFHLNVEGYNLLLTLNPPIWYNPTLFANSIIFRGPI